MKDRELTKDITPLVEEVMSRYSKMINRLVNIPWPERDVFEIYATDRIYQMQTARDRDGKITPERAKWMRDEWERRGRPPLRKFAKKVLGMSRGDTGYKPLRWPFYDKVLFNMSYWGHKGEYELLLNSGETPRWRRVAMLKLLYREPRKFTQFVEEHLQEFFDTDPPEVLIKPMVSKIGWVSEYLRDKPGTYRIIHQYSKRSGIPITPPDDDYRKWQQSGELDK